MEGLTFGQYSVEIDERTVPVCTPHLPTEDEAFPPDDDLDHSMSPNTKAAWLRASGLLRHGACVHVRIATTGDWGELVNIFVVWMGTPTEQPAIISAPGHTLRPDPA